MKTACEKYSKEFELLKKEHLRADSLMSNTKTVDL